jgi:hypothetical protein
MKQDFTIINVVDKLENKIGLQTTVRKYFSEDTG